jgi:hypothetical protein
MILPELSKTELIAFLEIVHGLQRVSIERSMPASIQFALAGMFCEVENLVRAHDKIKIPVKIAVNEKQIVEFVHSVKSSKQAPSND